MKTLRLVIMALAFGMLGVGLSSCDKEDKATIGFNGTIDEMRAYIFDCYPSGNLDQENSTTLTIKSLHDNNFPIHFDLYVRANNYAEDEYFAGEVTFKFNVLGVVYDADGNEVRRKTESFSNCRVGHNGSPIFERTNLFQVLAYKGETIHLSVPSVEYEGKVSKRCSSIYVSMNGYYNCISGGETYQSGEMSFEAAAYR